MNTRTIRRPGRGRRAAIIGAGLAAALVPVAAHAATIVRFDYDASGSTYIAKTKSTVGLGPTTLVTNLDVETGDFTGHLPLPGTTTEFKAAGFASVKADVAFIEAAPVQGHIALAGDIASVTSTAKYYVKLSNIKVFGFPTYTGSNCKTIAPVSIPANTAPGVGFDLIEGGDLKGTYTIGDFANCGANTWLINALVPGGGNTVDIHASNGRVVE